MPGMSPGSRRKQNYLSTAEAAKRMGVSKRSVRDLCRRGLLVGAFQECENGPWRISASAVRDWLGQRSSDTPEPPVSWQRFRYNPRVFYPTVVLAVLVTAVTLLAALVSAGADLGGFKRQMEKWGLLPTSTVAPALTATPMPLAYAPASEDELLIVIASFFYSKGIQNTEIHNEISRAIQQAAAETDLSHLRVEVEPTILTVDDRAGAEALGERYNASMVIWGADTGVRVIVNFLNLKQPGFEAAEVQISETESTQLANPSAYAGFVTRDLPGQLTFLSLFAIGQSYFTEEAYDDCIRTIERAIDSLAPEAEPPQGVAKAYVLLGVLYLWQLEDIEQAITYFDQAIIIDPEDADAYNIRGIAHYKQGNFEGAFDDLDRAIALRIHFTDAYFNRGLFRHQQGDLTGAIADYSQVIVNNPNHAQAYRLRGIARADLGDLVDAIADYDQAIRLNPNNAEAYYNRGNAYLDLSDPTSAIADFDQAIALEPGYFEACTNRGLARYHQGDLSGAIADYDQAIAIEPNNVKAYNNRGMIRANQGDFEGALADYNQAITIDPDYALAHLGRGIVYQQIGNAAAALNDFHRYLELQPDTEDREVVEAWIAELEAQTSEP